AGNRAALVDLDKVCLGEPAADVGSYLSLLRYEHLIGGLGAATERARATAFLTGYARRRPLPAPCALRWHTAAALLAEQTTRAAADEPPYLSPRAAAGRHGRALPLRPEEVRRGAPAVVRGGAHRQGAPPSAPLEPARHPDDRTPRPGTLRRARLHAREPLPECDPGPRRPA